MSTERKKSRRENPLVSLAVNIVIPVIILVRFSGEGPTGAGEWAAGRAGVPGGVWAV